MHCIFSPLADRDLEEIGDYIARDNPSRAVSFIQETIREQCAKIVARPLGAPLRHELGEGIRMASFGNYLIFYTVGAEKIRIERIMHGARSIPVLFDV
ncbi:MAG: type II toxin-antitoxin system RelE/ParE family toxin [Syntrophobacteraceae bacterium]|nr:type II toxin-antitoxin system RelE/ParE family toxin [Syntrophobacteraceae bacterium]